MIGRSERIPSTVSEARQEHQPDSAGQTARDSRVLQ
jgi:hypothetical protein